MTTYYTDKTDVAARSMRFAAVHDGMARGWTRWWPVAWLVGESARVTYHRDAADAYRRVAQSCLAGGPCHTAEAELARLTSLVAQHGYTVDGPSMKAYVDCLLRPVRDE